MSSSLLYTIAGVLLGASLGSYLGSFVWRLPRHIPLTGRSICAGCGREVPWYLNLPIVAYVILRGRSACCRTRLSVWYPVFETTTALAGATMGFYWGLWGLIALAALVVGGSLIVKDAYDARRPAKQTK